MIIVKLFSYNNFSCRSIRPNDTVSTFAILTPKSSGKKRITAKFVSNELKDSDGMINIIVSDEFNNNEIYDERIDNNNNNPDDGENSYY